MRMLRRMKKSCQLSRELRPMSMSSKDSPESRNATAACPSGICGAIHGTLTAEQCGCKGCRDTIEQLAKMTSDAAKSDSFALYF
jgi:hypothetical protein